MKTLKPLSLLVLAALLLTACGPAQPLGYCSADGLFYWYLGNPRNVRSSTPDEVEDQGYDPYAYGEWCPGGLPTATPTDTAIPPTATPTDTAEPSSPTPTDTAEPPAPTETLEPTATWPAPTPTNEPPERKPQVVIEKMWLLTEQVFGYWCVVISDSHPSFERQEQICGGPWVGWLPGELSDPRAGARIFNAPCAGPVYDNNVWACDDESLDWRQARWPDAEWLHGLGRLSLEDLCDKHPEYCQ